MIRLLTHLLAACLLAGCSSGAPGYPSPAHQSPVYQPSVSATGDAGSAAPRAKGPEMVREELGRFEAEPSPGCNSPDLLNAQAGVAALEGASADPAAGRAVGSLALDVADAAREKGCADVAAALYDHIIRTYVGAGYVSLRARAEAGMRRLEAGPG